MNLTFKLKHLYLTIVVLFFWGLSALSAEEYSSDSDEFHLPFSEESDVFLEDPMMCMLPEGFLRALGMSSKDAGVVLEESDPCDVSRDTVTPSSSSGKEGLSVSLTYSLGVQYGGRQLLSVDTGTVGREVESSSSGSPRARVLGERENCCPSLPPVILNMFHSARFYMRNSERDQVIGRQVPSALEAMIGYLLAEECSPFSPTLKQHRDLSQVQICSTGMYHILLLASPILVVGLCRRYGCH